MYHFIAARGLLDPCCESDPGGMRQLHLNNKRRQYPGGIKLCPE